MSICCKQKSVPIGRSRTFGDYYRCRQCASYWHLESARLWDEAWQGLVPVFSGHRAIGLANAVKCGMEPIFELLIPELRYEQRNSVGHPGV